MTIEVLWLAAASIGVGIHCGAWWEAWRDRRRGTVKDGRDPRVVMVTLQHWHALGRLLTGLINMSMALTVVLWFHPVPVTLIGGLALLMLTIAYGVSGAFELWTRAAVLDAMTDDTHRREAIAAAVTIQAQASPSTMGRRSTDS
jgi:hypothetical protein